MLKIVFIPGLPRCATTTLASLLVQHPAVAAPRHKEPHFFLPAGDAARLYAYEGRARRPYPTLGFCQDRAAYLHTLRAGTPATLHVDASTLYGVHPEAFAAIAADRDIDPSFIFLHRAPLPRARSHFRFSVSRGEEARTFEQALDEEARGERAHWLLGGYHKASALTPAVTRALALFGPERVRLANIDTQQIASPAFMSAVLDFLGLPAHDFDFAVYPNAVPDLTQPLARRARILARQARQLHPGLIDNPVTRWVFEHTMLRLHALSRGATPAHPPARETLRDDWVRRFADLAQQNAACSPALTLAAGGA